MPYLYWDSENYVEMLDGMSPTLKKGAKNV